MNYTIYINFLLLNTYLNFLNNNLIFKFFKIVYQTPLVSVIYALFCGYFQNKKFTLFIYIYNLFGSIL